MLVVRKISKQIRIATPVDPVILGKIGPVYGIRGWLRVLSSTDDTASIFDYQPWFIKKTSEWCQIELESWKRHKHQDLIIKIRGIEDRENATLLTNYEIVVDASQLPNLDNNEYYWKDLIGCRVVTTSGYQMGTVIDLMKTGSNDVLVVNANLKNAFCTTVQEKLIPFLYGQVIKDVDLTTHIIKVEWDPEF
ncbi:MAG: ribosome maturation factor RimM [Sodalis sp. Psp]|nr:ribosome maturation factor RimM [Sodalis sp. Psp]MCR3757210.1 ribosome maturation factor RimM [Sodalis sp. Ppy]